MNFKTAEEQFDREKSVSLEGEVYEIIYQNADNGYTVCDIDTGRELVTAVGIIPCLFVGEIVRFLGAFIEHPTYGRQFKFTAFEKAMPEGSDAMLKYLSSGSIKGVGPKTAARIVEQFGDESFDILENSPELLVQIKGISRRRAFEISDAFREQFGMRSVMIFFSEHFGPLTSAKIFKRWGSAAVDIVRNNPYLLCDEIHGIGFERADRFSMSLGMKKDSHERLAAGIKYVLKYNASNNGHLYLPYKKLFEVTRQMLETACDGFDECIERLCASGEIVAYDFEKMELSGGNKENSAIYTADYYTQEKQCAKKLSLLAVAGIADEIDDPDGLIENAAKIENITYDPLQKTAIKNAVTNSFSVITGGPGTGKTTIIKAILRIFITMGVKFALAAPTGRAAKKMSQATTCEAKTIHRLLEIEHTENDELKFFRNEQNPLDYDAIIIDEASMIDVPLFYSLLKAVRLSTRLILIGDRDQLPSVGAGNVLGDIIESGRFCVCRLDRIFRQSSDSTIVTNAHRINRGEYPDLSNKSSDFFFMPRSSFNSSAETVLELCDRRLKKTYGEDVNSKIQVITATRKGELGTVKLNSLLQNSQNPPDVSKKEKQVRDVIFREGDKVMQICNNYSMSWTKTESDFEEGLGIFNGDIGIITEINEEEEYFKINFDGKEAIYEFSRFDEIEHAWAITIHKSQGSEYPIVIIPVYGGSSLLMTRNLLYTAVTRAQSMVIMIGKRETVCSMVDNLADNVRYTGMRRMLGAMS